MDASILGVVTRVDGTSSPGTSRRVAATGAARFGNAVPGLAAAWVALSRNWANMYNGLAARPMASVLHQRGMMHSSTVLLAVMAAAITACGGGDPTDMFKGNQAQHALDKITKEIGHKDLRLLKVRVTEGQVEIYVENPKKRGTVQNFWYFKQEVGGPRKVTLIGSGSPAAGLFPIAKVDLSKLPQIARDARELWGREIEDVVLRRYVRVYARDPTVRWEITFRGGSFTAASIAGKVLPPVRRRRR